MAVDSVKIPLLVSGPDVATDQLPGGEHVQVNKLLLGDMDDDDGPVSATNPLPIRIGSATAAYTNPSVTGVSALLLAANPNRKSVTLSVKSNTSVSVYFAPGVGAITVGSGWPLFAGDVFTLTTTEAVQAITDGTTISVNIWEETYA